MANYPSAVGGNIDDSFSCPNKVILQHYLQNVGTYSQNRECDGVWGFWTTLEIQQYLRTQYLLGYPKTRRCRGELDGQFGNMAKGAMGDAACYLLGITGKTNYMYNKSVAGSCTVARPNTSVVKQPEQWLNYNHGQPVKRKFPAWPKRLCGGFSYLTHHAKFRSAKVLEAP